MLNNIPIDSYVLIIGAMKCGTTSLFNYLAGHPEICPAVVKEPEFFSEKQDHGVHVENYNDLWTFDSSVHKYAIEASTGYTKYPSELNVPKNISHYGIKPKFIYIVRNPIDRISSHINFKDLNRSWTLNVNGKFMIDISNYFIQLEQFRQYFNIRNILILDFDDLRDSPAMVLKKIYSFLDLPHKYFPNEYEIWNSNQKKNRILTNKEKEFIYSELKQSMTNLYQTYGLDVRKWNFNI